MSQSRRSNATAAANVGNNPNADTLADNYAEDLMDEIFEDVDRILAGDEAAIYAETATQEPVASAVFQAEAVTVPAMIVPLSAAQSMEASATLPIADPISSDEDGAAESEQATEEPSKKRPWRKLVLGVLCVSSLAAVGVWWMRQQRPSLWPSFAPAVVSETQTTVAAPPVSGEEAFGEYLTRSLRIIGGERTAQRETQGANGAVSTLPVPTSGSPQVASKPGVIERVFVPLLQPRATTQNPTATAAKPSASLPAPNTAEQPSGAQNGAAATVPNIAAVNTYELVGVLELGDRSAALFEIDGTSQRVYIGETIGASGWSIVSIGNEEVVVRRNGEERSIYIGQQF